VTRRHPVRTTWFGPVEPSTSRTTDGPRPDSDDAGRAIIEVVFLAVLMLIPILYLLISLVRIQAATLAVTQAARDAGRAIDTAPTIDEGIARARQIAAIDLADQHIPNGNITLQFVNPGAPCTADNATTPSLSPGAVYDLCITTTLTLPGVPTIVTGDDNTATGVYTVHISDLREGS
jgi:Flp pilus assembly protein TadG